ncbi:MAG: aspartyl protease family protein [Pyrinomonadaceae bacterium]
MARRTSAFLIALAVTIWAVVSLATAHSSTRAQASRIQQTLGSASTRSLPAPVRFREEGGRGLLVRAWVNGAGPYSFALDTGAGANIISQRVASEANVSYTVSRPVPISGISGAGGGTGREAKIRTLAIGERSNQLPAHSDVLVTDTLPPDLDGVLDPSDSYYPLGYMIDLPAGTVSAFDPRTSPVRASDAPVGGTVVRWLTESGARRPFVQLDNGRRALLDTGSNFGLALHESVGAAFGVRPETGRDRAGVRDLGRGHVAARRIAPITVQIGGLVLRRIPTDMLYGAAVDAPIILGRDALRPFQLSFDPVNRLILIAPR